MRSAAVRSPKRRRYASDANEGELFEEVEVQR